MEDQIMNLNTCSIPNGASPNRGGIRRRVGFVLLFMVLLIPPTVSIGSDGVSVRLVNQTGYYLHIIIDNQPFLYIAPGGSASHQSSALSAGVKVFYSPGQGVSGSMDRVVSSPLVQKSTADCSSDCNNTNSCVTQNSLSSVVNPVILYITPDSLQSTQGYGDSGKEG
jgi:hypothetical protein